MSEELPSIIEFSEDVSTAEAPAGLPARHYPATIKSAIARVSQNSGNTYMEVMFYIDPSEYPADYDASLKPDGVTIAYRRVLLEDTPAARYRLRRFCEAVGVVPGRKLDLNEFIGCEAVVTTTISVNEGVPREEIVKVSPVD